MNTKRVLAAIMAVMLLVMMLSGCSGSKQPEEPAETQQTAAQEESAAPEAEAEPQESESPEPVEEVPAVTPTEEYFPLAEKAELTAWIQWPGFLNTFLADAENESYYYTAMESATNVHLNLDLIDDTTASEKFNLMCAGGEYPELLVGALGFYDNMIASLIEDEVVYPLSDEVMAENMPTYYGYVTADETVYKSIRDDDGNIAAVYTIRNEELTYEKGFLVRQDWLDDLGISKPQTLDEIHDMLLAFKNEKGADMPIYVSNDGMSQYISTAFGIVNSVYVGKDGQLQSAYNLPEYKEYVAYMHQLYEEGLISQDFMSMTDSQNDTIPYVTSNRVGVVYDTVASITNAYEPQASDENMRLVATPYVLEGDAVYQMNIGTTMGQSSVSVSYTCEDVELALRYLDFCFTDQGFAISNYGTEDVTYTLDEDGNFQWTEFMTNNPDGLPFGVCTLLHTMFQGVCLKDMSRDYSTYNDDCFECEDIWMSAFTDSSMTYPSDYITLTDDEKYVTSNITTDLETTVDEWMVKFVTGDAPMDQFDDVIAQMQTIGLQTYLDTLQVAYERYLAR